VTWTYSNTGPFDGSTAGMRNQIRYLIGDIDSTVVQVTRRLEDEEIAYKLALFGNQIIWTASECCEDLVARMMHAEYGNVSGQLKTRIDWLTNRAKQLRARAYRAIAPLTDALSVASKTAAAEETDRVQPPFALGLLDNPFAKIAVPEDLTDQQQ